MTIDERIRRAIEGEIRSGALAPGVRLPTEAELVDRYGCARATVSKAMNALLADGLIVRRKKAGTFVAEPRVRTAILEIPDIAALIESRGDSYAFRLFGRKIRAAIPADPDEAPLDAREGLLELDGVHLSSGSPFALEWRLIALAPVPAAREVDFGGRSPGSWLLRQVPWTDARHRITARNATAAQARALALEPRAALLSVERWTWRESTGITFAKLLFPGNRHDLVSRFRAGGD